MWLMMRFHEKRSHEIRSLSLASTFGKRFTKNGEEVEGVCIASTDYRSIEAGLEPMFSSFIPTKVRV